MTDNADLIADARQLVRHSSVSTPEHANMLGRLADALEAVVQERDNWKMSAEEAERAEKRAERRADAAREEVGYEKRMREFVSGERDRFIDLKRAVEQDRNQLAAVVEKVRAVCDKALAVRVVESSTSQAQDAGLAAVILREVLATAPADALREVRAAAWDEGFDAGRDDLGAAARAVEHGEGENPYRTREEPDRG